MFCLNFVFSYLTSLFLQLFFFPDYNILLFPEFLDFLLLSTAFHCFLSLTCSTVWCILNSPSFHIVYGVRSPLEIRDKVGISKYLLVLRDIVLKKIVCLFSAAHSPCTSSHLFFKNKLVPKSTMQPLKNPLPYLSWYTSTSVFWIIFSIETMGL